MADVLLWSQIDALLKSTQNSSESRLSRQVVEQKAEAEETKYNRYDPYDLGKFTKEKMETLTSVLKNYARTLISQVNDIFRAMTDVMILEVQEYRYYEYVNSLYENGYMTLVDAYVQDKERNNIPLMLYITPGLVPTLVNHTLGGGDEVVKVDTSHCCSGVEVVLYRRVAEYCIQAPEGSFSNYMNVAFKVQRMEENPSVVQGVSLGGTAAIVHLNVDVAGPAVEKIQLCLPGTLLEYIFHMIDSRKHITRGFAYEDNKDIILGNIHYIQFLTTGQLVTVELDASDIYHFKIDDVIDLSRPQNSRARPSVGRQPWLLGEMGVYKRDVVVRIQG